MNTVIATTPGAMVEAQGKLVGWVVQKLAAVARETEEMGEMMQQLRLARVSTKAAERSLDNLRRRERFYEKVKTALDAGFYIIPPFDCQVFAVRTDREAPPEDLSRIREPRNDAVVPGLPAGKGGYVHPVPLREHKFHDVEKRDGKDVEIPYFSNTAWDEVEFPVRAMKPSLIAATREAMAMKIFDAFGIAPPYRTADPIIVGRIKHWKQGRSPLTFFVAWWLDEDDL